MASSPWWVESAYAPLGPSPRVIEVSATLCATVAPGDVWTGIGLSTMSRHTTTVGLTCRSHEIQVNVDEERGGLPIGTWQQGVPTKVRFVENLPSGSVEGSLTVWLNDAPLPAYSGPVHAWWAFTGNQYLHWECGHTVCSLDDTAVTSLG